LVLIDGNVWSELIRPRPEPRVLAFFEKSLNLASQAIAAGMPLVTRNVSDMARTGAVIINPWEA
jgi:predicted nucleic acid-binding protein